MSYRVTQGLLTGQLKRSLALSASDVYQLQERISLSKRLLVPSDEAADFAKALNLRDAIGVAQRYKRNSEDSAAWLDATDTQLSAIVEYTQSLETTVVQAASDTMSAAERADLAASVNETLEALVALANSEEAGRYLFAGHETLRSPFTIERGVDGKIANVTYLGNDGAMRREIATNDIIAANVTGRALFLESAYAVRARDGAAVFAEPSLAIGDAAQGFVPPFGDTIVSLNGKEIRLSGTQSLTEVARAISDDPDTGVTATVEQTPVGAVPPGYRLVLSSDDTSQPISLDWVSGANAGTYTATGGNVWVDGVRVDLVAGDDATAIAGRINAALTAAGVSDVRADVLAHTSGSFLRIVGPEGEQVEVRDGSEALFATLGAESFLAKQGLVDGENAIIGDQTAMDNVFETLIRLRDDLESGEGSWHLPEASVLGSGTLRGVTNTGGYLSGQILLTTDASGAVSVDYTHVPPLGGASFDATYLSLAATDDQVRQLRVLNRAIVTGETRIADPDERLDSGAHVSASPPPGWASSPSPKAFTINGESFSYTGAESLREIATMISAYDFAAAGKVDVTASVDSLGRLNVESADGSPLDIQDTAVPAGTGLMESLGLTQAGGLETKAATLSSGSLSAFGITLDVGTPSAGTQSIVFGPLVGNSRIDNLSEIGLTMRVAGGGITEAFDLPSNGQSGTYRVTVTGPLSYGALTTTTTGAVTATVASAHTMQSAGRFTMELDALGNTVANTVRYTPANNGGAPATAEQLAQLAALNAGGVPPDLSSFGLAVTPGAGAGTLEIGVSAATAEVRVEFEPVDGTRSIVTTDRISAYSTNELTQAIPGGKLITGALHVGGQSIITSTSRVREIQRDLSLETSLQSSVGSLSARASASATLLATGIEGLSDMLGAAEKLDVPSALIDLQERQNVYDAALAVGARVILPTLMDYLQ